MGDDEKPPRNQPKGLRWPPDLLEAVKMSAKEDVRDFTKQVIWLLQQGLEQRKLDLEANAKRKSSGTDEKIEPESLRQAGNE